MANLQDGSRAIHRLSESLRSTSGLAEAYAQGILDQAVRNAARKPTPQSRMAAEVMGIRQDTIEVLSGGPPAEVSGGSEWGSNIYPQFGPRNDGGYWLHPAAESPEAEAHGDRYLEDLAQRAVRGF